MPTYEECKDRKYRDEICLNCKHLDTPECPFWIDPILMKFNFCQVDPLEGWNIWDTQT